MSNYKIGDRVRKFHETGQRVLTITRVPLITDKHPYYEGYIGAAKNQIVKLSIYQMYRWRLFD